VHEKRRISNVENNISYSKKLQLKSRKKKQPVLLMEKMFKIIILLTNGQKHVSTFFQF